MPKTRFGYDRATDHLPEPEDFGPSKTQVKDEMHDLQELGVALLELPPSKLARFAAMDERLREAFVELRRLTNVSARARHAGYIGKLLAAADAEAFRRLLADWRHGKAQAAQGYPEIAKWRDRLLAEDEALTEWFARHPTGDTRALRTLVRSARKEEAAALAESAHTGQPAAKGAHYRALFQHLRATVEAADDAPADAG